jgi:opacity protein-like surface antigen
VAVAAYADVHAGVTFGHQSSGSVAGECGVRVTDALDVFEGGHLWNVGTQDLDTRARTIANAAYRVSYVDVGVRYRWRATPRVQRCVAAGVGVAHVRSETVLSVNGTAVAPDSRGIQFGPDLNGTVTKPFLAIGGGATMPLHSRYVADVGVRYGRILPRTSQLPHDQGINTVRVQAGIGVRF